MDKKEFEKNPRGYALELVSSGLVDAESLLRSILVTMSHHDVRGALDANELSPRFMDEDDSEDED